jgi:DNA-binding response OmpR family regulator
VLLDLRMPHMDGLEVLRRLRATREGHDTLVIVVTASAFDEDRYEAMKAGADDFIAKPFVDSELFEKLRAHLGLSYQYQEAGPICLDLPPASSDLQELPPGLREVLRDALLEADPQRISRVIQEIRKGHDALAGKLAASVRNFEYQALLDLLSGGNPP